MDFSIHIPENVARIIARLNAAGFEAGLVGGCLRDELMGRQAKDYDIVTSALPDQMMKVLSDYRQLVHDLKHGTLCVVEDNKRIEINTYKTADVQTSADGLTQDLSLRDFTINSIYYDDKHGLYDPFGGAEDIKNKIVRCTGDADKRMKEDPIRILRAMRFAAVLGFKIEEGTRLAMLENMRGLDNIALERVATELVKIVQGNDAHRVMDEYKPIIAHVLPELGRTMGFEQHNLHHIYDVWQHSLTAMDNVEGIKLRLAMLFHDIGKPSMFTMDDGGQGHFYFHEKESCKIAKSVFKRIKLTSADGIDAQMVEDICQLIMLHGVQICPTRKSLRRLYVKLNGDKEQFKDLIRVKQADVMAQNPELQKERLRAIAEVDKLFDQMMQEDDCITLSKLAVNGNDLKAAGITDGKAIGKTLKCLVDMVINDELENDKQKLLSQAKQMNHINNN